MNLWTDLKDFLFPRTCLGCGKPLLQGEDALCIGCMADLPRTHLLKSAGNEMERFFWGRFPIERASSLLYYNRGGRVAHLLHAMKYYGHRKLCVAMGKLLAAELSPSGFFDDIDRLIPVPLHKTRLRSRGYNQSQLLAEGIAHCTDLPIEPDTLFRLHNNATQTRQSMFHRSENTEKLFDIHTDRIEPLQHSHVLLVDDVLTTGSTLTACAHALGKVEGIRISVATLAWAKP